jgi:hypothetical protein
MGSQGAPLEKFRRSIRGSMALILDRRPFYRVLGLKLLGPSSLLAVAFGIGSWQPTQPSASVYAKKTPPRPLTSNALEIWIAEINKSHLRLKAK